MVSVRKIAALAAISSVSADVFPVCDPDFDCIYKVSDDVGTFYEFDFRPLCDSKGGMKILDTGPGNADQLKYYILNICGNTLPDTCLPASEPNITFTQGPAVQFFGAAPVCDLTTTVCRNQTGQPACCTADCEVLGYGPPIWKAHDTTDLARGGLNLTYQGIPYDPDDQHPCPPDPNTGVARERDITVVFDCDVNATTPVVYYAQEASTCDYVIKMRTAVACGCDPQCTNKICGPDSCGGFCSGDDLQGGCPNNELCMEDGTCCRPDCTNRDCGSNGCGGSCGTCGDDETCNENYQLCVDNDMPFPNSPIVYKTDHSGLAGSFFGGLFTAIVGFALYIYFTGSGSVISRFTSFNYSSIFTRSGASSFSGYDATKSIRPTSSYGGYGAASTKASEPVKANAFGSTDL